MSIFSENLSSLIKKSKYTLPYLADESGYSVAMLSKIKSGKRLPVDEKNLLLLLQALRATPFQTKKVLEEFHIEKIGRENYNCFVTIKNIFENLSVSASLPSSFSKDSFYHFSRKPVFKGEENINNLVQSLVDLECIKKDPSIKLFISTDYLFLNKYLAGTCLDSSKKGVSVQHVFHLLPATAFQSDYTNLLHITNLFTLINHCENYQPFYVYSEDSSLHPYPYYLLTSDYLLVLSEDYTTGFLTSEKEILSEYHSAFDNSFSLANPLLQKIPDAINYLQYISSLPGSLTPPSTMLSVETCLLHSIPPDMALAHISPDLAADPYIMEFLNAFFTVPVGSSTNIFSLESLDSFIKNGTLLELPLGSYTPFSPEEAKIIIKDYYEKSKNGLIKNYIIKPTKFKPSPYFVCYAFPPRIFTMFWQAPFDSSSYYQINEKSVTNAFFDFMEYLCHSEDYTYSEKESFALLTDFVKNLD